MSVKARACTTEGPPRRVPGWAGFLCAPVRGDALLLGERPWMLADRHWLPLASGSPHWELPVPTESLALGPRLLQRFSALSTLNAGLSWQSGGVTV